MKRTGCLFWREGGSSSEVFTGLLVSLPTGLLQVAYEEKTEHAEAKEKLQRRKERKDRRTSFSKSVKREERAFRVRKKGKEKSECVKSGGFFGSLPFFISSSVISVSLWCIPFSGNLQNFGSQ
ncbi:MAG: hypothetical protein D6679_11750 [Candidatus Hydrogenedentota bacterium]|nr:MAG: hypothetical protein D6679_11750 [Candidatus Hydrogenedentota bacterium]